MTEIFELRGYCPRGSDPERRIALHNLTVNYTKRFLTDQALQYFLLPGLEKPVRSWHDIHNCVWNRAKVSGFLSYVEYVIERATKPMIVYAERPVIFTGSDDDLCSVRVLGTGAEPQNVEHFQQEWMSQHTTRETVRKYAAILQSAFDAYNLQFMLHTLSPASLTKVFRESDRQFQYLQ
ncbi:MAG: hypothetical protein HY513_03530 [Candidatus Aenigmarchaeota archaeon]|nr:hypothetical protein [Candidatus Aenigmarchaeota archaeon]